MRATENQTNMAKELTSIILRTTLYMLPLAVINYAFVKWFQWELEDILVLTVIYVLVLFAHALKE